MRRSAQRIFFIVLLFGIFFFCATKISYAETTQYRSASLINTRGNIPYINLENCSETDGLTCDKLTGILYSDLYFQNFGDFGIPDGSTITNIRIRVTGKSSTPSLALFTALSRLRENSNWETGLLPFYESCQSPSDKWRMYALNSSEIKTYEVVTPITNGNLVNCLTVENIKNNNFVFQLHYSNGSEWSASIDNFEIAFDYTPPLISPTPSPGVSPTPTPPLPFLDLPWNYIERGLSFTESALAINSFFDHEYPLLSTSLAESIDVKNSIIAYKGIPRSTDNYSSHDGYDYGTPAKLEYGDEVLAAADGKATYLNSCSACGNAILIDHGNGYQTRYYHLQKDGLVTDIPGQEISVNSGDVIGRVGATGNVKPPGEAGAHLHFMVIKDKNADGKFDDNIPDGIVDPFGWQSEALDPWENYSFFYNGQDRTGIKSYYLWKDKIDGLDADLTSNGGVFKSGRTTVSFPQNATNQNLSLKLNSLPSFKFSDEISSIGSAVEITAKDLLGNIVSSFNQPYTLEMDFSGLDISRYLIDSISIYSSIDGSSWQKEATNVDLANKNASSSLDHLTKFAIMAERVDIKPATTTSYLSGAEGNPGWFRSSVVISLESVDNPGGLGVNYILYKIESSDWQKYEGPIEINAEGEHTLEFYSVDNDENIEAPKIKTFVIDKTIPEAEIYYSASNKNIEFLGKDGTLSAKVEMNKSGKDTHILVTDKAGNRLKIVARITLTALSASIGMLSLSYNNVSKPLDKNNLLILPIYNSKNKNLISITEIFTVKDKDLIASFYSFLENKTKIYLYDRASKQILKENLIGEHLLKLTTQNGTLRYRY